MYKANTIKPEYIQFSIILFVLGMLNVFGNYSLIISLISSVLAYVFILIPIIKNNNFERSFIYFIACMAIMFEQDEFIYGEDTTFNHYTIMGLPIVGGYLFNLLAISYFLVLFKKVGKASFRTSTEIRKVMKCIYYFFITGTITVTLCMIMNDNGMMKTNYYPKHAILTIYEFVGRVSIILAAIFICTKEQWKSSYSIYLQIILIVVVFVSVAAALLGFSGYYSDNIIMLAPHSFTFAPFLLLFFVKKLNTPFRYFSLITAIIAIVASFAYGGVAMGSKWYLFILGSAAGIIFIIFEVKSLWTIMVGTIISLILLPLLLIPISRMSFSNDYIGWKLNQSVQVISLLGEGGASEWYGTMDMSPLFRLEELQCILIEYYKKPEFILFGKGFGGTIKHYTNILSWEGKGGFPSEQQKLGAYSNVHESFLSLTLTHGLLGLYFLFSLLGILLKRAYRTPWAIIGVFWLFFFWNYSYSMMVGAVALAIALCDKNDLKTGKILKKQIL